MDFATRLRRGAGAFAVDNFFRTASLLGRFHPRADPRLHGVTVRRDLAYLPSGRREHLLDVYRPADAPARPLPIIFYVHGGGFRILSKDTHWIMALAFARAGYLVFNVSYRLAPRHRFPAGLRDCAQALEWVHDHAASWGGDPSRLTLAGESAGANLVTSLALMTSYRRPEPWARRLFEREVRPRVLLPYCGMLQVSDPERFRRRKPDKIGPFMHDRLCEVGDAYLGPDPQRYGSMLALADPLVWLERGVAPERPLPACLAVVGTADPLLDDTRRLHRALTALGVDCEARYYDGEVHAFHALLWRDAARRSWADTYRFLERRLATGDAAETPLHPRP